MTGVHRVASDASRRCYRHPLRVGLIAPAAVPVPPPVYGGTEAVVDRLARGLAAAGCEVELFASGDSTCPVRTRSLHPIAIGTTADPADELAHVAAAYRTLDGVDIIHDHTEVGPAHPELAPAGTPVVTTVHGLFGPASRAVYRRAARRMAVVTISHEQHRRRGDVPVDAVIHHGLADDEFHAGPGDGGYVAFLGRMSPTKGPDAAIRAARAAGWPIVLAAKIWEPDELAFFHDVVEPMLGADATFVGEVGPTEKAALLGRAAALVNPIRWPEPFGLVMIEALACGTPVLAFPQGAAPEIVRDGIDGFLCRDETDLTARLGQLSLLDRTSCRAGVLTRFSSTTMVERHLDLYGRLVTGGLGRLASRALDLARPPARTVDELMSA